MVSFDKVPYVFEMDLLNPWRRLVQGAWANAHLDFQQSCMLAFTWAVELVNYQTVSEATTTIMLICVATPRASLEVLSDQNCGWTLFCPVNFFRKQHHKNGVTFVIFYFELAHGSIPVHKKTRLVP